MAYFHEKWVKNRGGSRRRPMRRLVGETIDQMLKVSRRWPEATKSNWPVRGKEAYKSKSIPMLWVDADRDDILKELDSCEVSEDHVRLLTWMIREEFYRTRCGGHTPETEKFFQLEIRGNLIRLLRNGSWVDEPENLGLKNLNNRLEKFDLGRRTDLNFSSNAQSGVLQKYDQDFKQDESGDLQFKDTAETPDFEKMYRDGSKDLREELLKERPWMKSKWITEYGEP